MVLILKPTVAALAVSLIFNRGMTCFKLIHSPIHHDLPIDFATNVVTQSHKLTIPKITVRMGGVY